MSKPVVMIECWAVVENVTSQSFEALHPGNRLMGYALGHATLPNTKLIYTSPIVKIDLSQRLVETFNTIYRLGDPSEDYKSWVQKRTVAA
ncbi:hypothetical protein H7849_07870 [Alloacidobacterium dinghuense]|uniref:Uncharacterized protein n=1 Tax=Alloacidobacterium dinghuense TaxID=2763107 RepID=A0A7G8BMQ1_9BACT|nr:hypothetical protein [Alloacidobacterium dinghuense]QNI33821.1 hypothetical protein H7849_07870 [Alloacidobacterium dinghuense]